MIAHVNYTERLQGHIDAPSSKNYTTRYIHVSCLAKGESEVHPPAHNDDAAAMIECSRALGASIRKKGDGLVVKGYGNKPRNPGTLNPHNAGTVLRFLLGTCALLKDVTLITDYPHSLGKRPNQDLLDALEQLGAKSESDQGHLPIRMRGGKLNGGEVKISGSKSSQYLSSLLFLAPLIGKDLTIKVTGGLKSQPLIETTLEVLSTAGISLKVTSGLREFFVPGGQNYKAGKYTVNGDFPASSAILSAAAVTSSEVTVSRLFRDCQGERAILTVLRDMGVEISHRNDTVSLNSKRRLKAIEFNGDKATDAVLNMAAVACFAKGTSRFYNIENIRYKECDRISEPLEELEKIGVHTKEKRDEIMITGNPDGYEGGVEVDAHSDHRVIMMLAIVGLGCRKGLKITNAQHVSKSYPDFFKDLQSLGAKVNVRGR